MNLEGPMCVVFSCSIKARSQRDSSKKHKNCMGKWAPNLEGFRPEKFTVQVKERDTCLAQTSLGPDEPAVAGGTTNRGRGKRHNPWQRLKTCPRFTHHAGAVIVLIFSSSTKPTNYWAWTPKYMFTALPLGSPQSFKAQTVGQITHAGEKHESPLNQTFSLNLGHYNSTLLKPTTSPLDPFAPGWPGGPGSPYKT